MDFVNEIWSEKWILNKFPTTTYAEDSHKKSVFFTSPKILSPTSEQNSLKIPNTEIFHPETGKRHHPNKAHTYKYKSIIFFVR